jgi:hypothetical protein
MTQTRRSRGGTSTQREVCMIRLHHVRHSILAVGLGLAAISAANVARAEDSPYFGRWTVSEENPKFSAKGKFYKTFDVGPCGKDFCGVSVGDDGKCGPTLFRFLTSHAAADQLKGHGLWGNEKKNLEMSAYDVPDSKDKQLQVDLGDGHDFGSREGSEPIYDSTYKRVSAATCMAPSS